MSPQVPILAAIAVPLAGIAGIVLWGERHRNMRDATTLLVATTTFCLVASLYGTVVAGGRPAVSLGDILPDVPLAFMVEPLGLLYALIASGLWIVTTLYAIGYMRGHHEENQTRFYAFFALAIAAALGIAFSANMATLFVFYEVLTMSTFPLVAHHGTKEARHGARTYLGILLTTSIVFLLLAVVWTWAIAGTLDFTVGGILAGKADGLAASVLLLLYVFGIGKAAVMPFHRWLPAAMVAPTPVSALLHAVAVVKAGVFSVLKVAVYLFGLDFLSSVGTLPLLQVLAAATIVIASLVALRQDNLKRRLAYSTVSQLSYIVLGAMLANSLGAIGGGMHIATHAFGKITLFFCAGAYLVAAHKTEVSQLNGIGRTMPYTTAAFLIGALSIIGLPPFGGLWSKWYLALGALDAGHVALVAVLMISSLLNIAYLLPIPLRGFFAKPDEDHGHGHAKAGVHEAPVLSVIAIGLTAAGCVILFVYPDPLYALLKLMVVR